MCKIFMEICTGIVKIEIYFHQLQQQEPNLDIIFWWVLQTVFYGLSLYTNQFWSSI